MCKSEGAEARRHEGTKWMVWVAVCLLTGCATTPEAPETKGLSPTQRAYRERVSKGIPNIEAVTQHGERVRFYDDLVKDRVVLVYFMFTTCEGICPVTTANVARMQELLGDRFGRDVFFIAATLTPEIDTPEVLRAYAEQYGAKPGWTFVTGDKDDLELLRRKLGIYDPDPIVDADLYSHAGLVTFGNDRTGRWRSLPGTMPADDIVRTMLRITRDPS